MMTRNFERFGGVLVILFGCTALFLIVRESLNPDAYFRYANEELNEDWRWPWRGVAILSVFTVVETLVGLAAFWLRRPSRMWQRGLAAAAALFGWSAFHVGFVVHSPGYFMMHIAWLWFLSSLLLVAALISAVLTSTVHVSRWMVRRQVNRSLTADTRTSGNRR